MKKTTTKKPAKKRRPQSTRIIDAKEIILRDNDGAARIALKADSDGWCRFSMFDGGENEMVRISVDKEGDGAWLELKTRENMAAIKGNVCSANTVIGKETDGAAYLGVEYSNDVHGIDLHASEDGANIQFMEEHDVEEVLTYEQLQNISACSTTFARERDSYARKPQSSPKETKAGDPRAASVEPSVMPKLLPVWVLLGMDDTWEFDIHYEPYNVVDVKDGKIFYRSNPSYGAAEIFGLFLGCLLT